jgi:hypothetical protein
MTQSAAAITDFFAPRPEVGHDAFGLPPVVAAGIAVLEHSPPRRGSHGRKPIRQSRCASSSALPPAVGPTSLRA